MKDGHYLLTSRIQPLYGGKMKRWCQRSSVWESENGWEQNDNPSSFPFFKFFYSKINFHTWHSFTLKSPYLMSRCIKPIIQASMPLLFSYPLVFSFHSQWIHFVLPHKWLESPSPARIGPANRTGLFHLVSAPLPLSAKCIHYLWLTGEKKQVQRFNVFYYHATTVC